MNYQSLYAPQVKKLNINRIPEVPLIPLPSPSYTILRFSEENPNLPCNPMNEFYMFLSFIQMGLGILLCLNSSAQSCICETQTHINAGPNAMVTV